MAKVAPDYLKELEAIEEHGPGLMTIFSLDPKPAFLFYAAMVTAYVNQEFRPELRIFSLDEMTAALAGSPELRDLLATEMRKRQ